MTSYQKLKIEIRELKELVRERNNELIVLSREDKSEESYTIKTKWRLVDNAERAVWFGDVSTRTDTRNNGFFNSIK